MNATTTEASFDETILPYQATLLRAALGYTHDATEAHDLVQDVIERALRGWTRFTPGTDARAWMSTILNRLFIDRWRQRRRQPRQVSIEQVELATPEAEGLDEAGPAAWEEITQAEIRQAVTELPERLRQVFELNAFGGLTYAQISATTGIRASTVGTRLLRARRRLRTRLLASGARA